MTSIEEIRSARLAKLNFLTEQGINPYPATVHRDITCEESIARFDELTKSGKSLYMVGRIMSLRAQGKITFFDFYDGTGRFQAFLKKGEPLKEELYELFEKAFDIGDFVEVKGTFFLTKRDEKTILVEEIRMLAKSLRPLPEKWHGLTDVEERFRKRYLDLLSNLEVKERFIFRTKVVTEIRKILDGAGYLEVETPVLQPLYGGASAEPFVTHHKALDTDLYLRISDELYLKRLLAAGFPKVYEIARDFRNEGIDITHNPEFTMLEFYEAYSNATEQRIFVEDMIRRLVFLSNSQGKIVFDSREIDFNKPFEVTKYGDFIREHTELGNPLEASLSELVKEADRLGSNVEDRHSSMKVLDAIFKKIRPAIIQPTFLVDYPLDMLPLTKKKEDNPKLVDAFQLYAGGIELVKAFSELNDPVDQRERFEVQEKNKKEGDKEAQLLDEDFIEAMEYGIPPAGGVGIGIDRLAMLLTGVKNIKEVILFPTLKPKN
ncbi:MAG: lysine--tRNA ligase [bacterium]|nr:lysine--tRNA ligase [bacterium]